MRIKTKTKRVLKLKAQRIVAAFLAINILFQAIAPTCAFALTGGPSQPEVQAFTPVGTSEMVDPFTGDFSYNIPLLDVDGYPINIGYNSGITMDQEASWVGLGWNISPGVINRGTRGLPDDFNGDAIVKEMNIKPNKTYGLNMGAGAEIFGLDKDKIKKLKSGLGLGYTLGIKYNNYNGYGVTQSFNLSLVAGDDYKGPVTAGLGINSSADEGLSLQPSVGLSNRVLKIDRFAGSLSFGGAFNSRAGLKQLTINTSYSTAFKSSGLEVGSQSTFDLGTQTYTPNVSMPMQNLSITGNFKVGGEAIGIHPNASVGGYYSGQKLATNIISNPAYGYMNADEGTKYDNALMDFNREKEGSFTTETPALPLTNFTYDILSVSGQGISGSYRPFRSDMGHVFDPTTKTTSVGVSGGGSSLGGEIGIGSLTHYGVDLTVNSAVGESGRWKKANSAATALSHKTKSDDPLYEKYYFKEANEKSVDADPSFFNKAGAYKPRAIYLNQLSKYNIIADKYYATINSTQKYAQGAEIKSDNTRKVRERRNQPLTILTRAELNDFALEDRQNSLTPLGVNPENAKAHHIAEITTLRSDGARYVYGIAAYNTKQEEVTFAVGKTASGDAGRPGNKATGLVKYVTGDNELTNGLGRDNYFSNLKTPAFAHSYLLTAVLSSDYVDSDNSRGPSDGDIGSYTKLNYDTRVSNYKWRTPVGERQANYSEGLESDPTDDKASYLYGEKDLMYLTSIETKNYVAVFSLEDREDGFGVVDKNGKLETTNPMKLLRKIALYPKKEYQKNPSTAVAIKTVNFEYDYSLCQGIANNKNGGGKLTLKKIFFTYQNSNKARLSPYEFTYSSFNPSYNIKGYDRWGNYKPVYSDNNNSLYSSEFPYVEQNKTNADQYTQAWTLTEIYLPSGGKIKVEFESDDYAYIQNKQAGQMFKLVGAEDASLSSSSFATPSLPAIAAPINMTPANTNDVKRLIVKLQTTLTGSQTEKDTKFRTQYLKGIDYLYFRFLMRIQKQGITSAIDRDEFVSGYLTKNNMDESKSFVDPSGNYACIAIKNIDIDDKSAGFKVSPFTKAAIQFGRLNMPQEVWSLQPLPENQGFDQVLKSLANSSFLKNAYDMLKGPNKSLYATYNIGKEAIIGKSWVRLNNPNKNKLGGGSRVKKIQISDEWDGSGISNSPANANNFGQEYSYTLEDGTSSGVATYEPQIGGDENPWKQPVFFNYIKLLIPDDEHYMEEPFGESFFPSPVVGYSRVTIKNLTQKDANGNVIVTHNATGKTVHQFYTAKDFPTITERTDLKAKREKPNPLSLSSLFNLKSRDYMTASQGYVIELNDMHGKPQKQEVYQEGQAEPITSVEYVYKSTTYNGAMGNSGIQGAKRLDNTATVINSDGTVDNAATIGMFFDYVSDMRQSTNETTSAGINVNVDVVIFPPALPFSSPIFIPSYSNEKTQFRSAVTTKVIQRFGILEEVIAKDLSSIVSTKNIAYDAETGGVLLTETITDYNDKIYSLNYPAYWYYNGMAPAYKNVGFSQDGITFTTGTASVPHALAYFAEGDELSIENPSNGTKFKAWVITVTPNSVLIIDKKGDLASGNFIKVLRSGKRNQQGVPMASIATLTNPINAIQANIYENVLQAEAMEYTNSWKTYCDCFQGASTAPSDNPYVIGTKGMYKSNKSYVYLAGRTQSNYNKNTNLRKDGVLTSYSPFYKLNAGNWQVDNRNWTFTSEITEYSPFGIALENKDALGRYSSSILGYAQSLPVAAATNAKYQDIGFDNFEDYDSKTCADNHFKFNVALKPNSTNTVGSKYENIDVTTAHTGKNSIKVASGTPVNMTKQLTSCTTTFACNLSVVSTATSTDICYEVQGGVAPYQFEWNSPNCDVIVAIADSGNKVCVSKSSFQSTGSLQTCSFILKVTDKNNCKELFPLTLSNLANPTPTGGVIK